MDAVGAEGQVVVAMVALRDKEHLSTVRLKDDVFVLETVYWPDEIREADFEELSRDVKIRDAEVKMARQLIQQLAADFEPEQFRDEYRERLQELAERKIEGEEVAVAQEPAEEPTKVVDLMEALKASVAEAKQRKAGDGEAAPKKAARGAGRDASAS